MVRYLQALSLVLGFILWGGCTTLDRYEVQIDSITTEVAIIGKTGPPWSRFTFADRFIKEMGKPPVYIRGDSDSSKWEMPTVPKMAIIP